MKKKQKQFLRLQKYLEMATRPIKTTVSNLQIETVRKDIKNIHLGVYPPNGRVRISAPLKTSDESLRLFIISKIPWIRKQKDRFSKQERQTKREYITGESHYFFGKRYQLIVNKTDEKPQIEIYKKTHLEMYVKPNTTVKQKQKMLENFYRTELAKIIPKLLLKWERKVGVKANEIKIKKMKTKWGACTSKDKRIWLNLELAKKPVHCIDYVFVHELVHIIEGKHSERFLELLEAAYPKWQQSKDELNQGVLSHFEWGCRSNTKLEN